MTKEEAVQLAKWMSELFPSLNVAQVVVWKETFETSGYSLENARKGITIYHRECMDGIVRSGQVHEFIRRCSMPALKPTEKREQMAKEQMDRVKRMQAEDAERYERGERINKAIDALSANELNDVRAAAMAKLPEQSQRFFARFHAKHPYLRELIYREMMGDTSPVGAP